jgi:phosphoglycerate-specific signal transduction histidine kinase
MEIDLVIALISGVIALLAAGLAIWGQVKAAHVASQLESLRLAEQRRFEKENTIARYREPLAQAAYDLQSRIYNIVQRNFLQRYLTNGTDRERGYAINNTVFVLAQYFAWTEIVRSDIQFIDLGEDAQTRELRRLQDNIYAILQNDAGHPLLRVFAGEQRAVGERLVTRTRDRADCMGYGAFLDQLPAGKDPLLDALRDDVVQTSRNVGVATPRLVALQHALIDLLAYLDPDNVRFSEDRRSKVNA